MPEISEKIMNFFYFKQKYQSQKNGEIVVLKKLFWYEVLNGGCFQSGPYVNHLWKKLLRRVPKTKNKQNVLLLGLGGGGGIIEVEKRFKRANITAIEYDPVMIEIAKNTYLKGKRYGNVRIVGGDASEVIKRLEEKFDIIMIDLFNGKIPSPILYSADFLTEIQRHLELEGQLLVNFYNNEIDLGIIFDQYFSRWQNLKYQYNKMAIYKHFGLGNPADPVPEGFRNKEQSLIYLKTQIINPTRHHISGEAGCYGLNKDFGIFTTEDYVSLQEPKLAPCKKPRLVFWRPIRQTKTKGWLKNPLATKTYVNGMAALKGEDYWQTWTEHAKRHRNKWLKNDQYEIIEVNFDEFKQAYNASKRLDWLTRSAFLSALKFHLRKHKQDLFMFAAREKASKKIIGGLAVVDYPDIGLSIHTISFFNKDTGKTSVGFGLIDYWYKHGLEKKLKFLNFGIIWHKGNPRAWKGYSIFKKQFNLYRIYYPEAYIKFTFK